MDSRPREAVTLLVRLLLEAGKCDQARRLLEGLLADDPDDVLAQRGLVHAQLRLGRYEEALALAGPLAAKERGPGRTPALFSHAHALWGCGREAECRRVVEAYARSLREAPARPTAVGQQKH